MTAPGHNTPAPIPMEVRVQGTETQILAALGDVVGVVKEHELVQGEPLMGRTLGGVWVALRDQLDKHLLVDWDGCTMTTPEPTRTLPDRTHLEVFRDAAGEWRWRYRADNGRILAGPQEGYTSWIFMLEMLAEVTGGTVRDNAMSGLELVRGTQVLPIEEVQDA